jgi:threonine dehydrogenase-like Zn-dependent dehydrogenase
MLRPLGTFVELGCSVDDGRTVPLNVSQFITAKDLILYGVQAQPPHSLHKALRTLAATHQRIAYTALVGAVLPVAQAGEGFQLLEDPRHKPIKVAIRGAGY